MSNIKAINRLLKKYKLDATDYFKHAQGWHIITRTGIEKIQAAEDIRVSYSVIKIKPDFAVIKASATKGSNPDSAHYFGDKEELYDKVNAIPVVETFGSAKQGPFKTGTTMSWYIAEMAEKRALSRAVLKLTGLYSYGVYSEEEAEDFADDRKELTSNIINRVNNAILRGEQTAEEAIKALEQAGYIVGESLRYGWKRLKVPTQEYDTNNV